MLKIPLTTWIANAAVSLSGLHGDVTRQARLAVCSRQTIYDHAHKVQAAVVDAHDGGPARATLIAENQRLARENAQLWRWLEETIEFPVIKQHEFVAIATAMGLSLNQVLALLALILGGAGLPRPLHAAPMDQTRRLGGGPGPQAPRCSVPGIGPGRLPR